MNIYLDHIKTLKREHAIFGVVLSFIQWSTIYLSNLTGYLRINFIRVSLYRYVFRMDIPRDSIIYSGCKFYDPWNIHIGHHSIINDNVFLDGRNEIYIGDSASISREAIIYTLEHDVDSPDFGAKGGKVVIGNWAFIGSRAMILPGVTIGDGAVVAAGAVVTKNVEPWSMVGGVPAKFIRTRPRVEYVLPTGQKNFFQ